MTVSVANCQVSNLDGFQDAPTALSARGAFLFSARSKTLPDE
jgi:hypothetical protein